MMKNLKVIKKNEKKLLEYLKRKNIILYDLFSFNNNINDNNDDKKKNSIKCEILDK